MTPRVENFAKCGCGHTKDPNGHCDGSHAFITEDIDDENIDWGDEE
jgi:CDGSH-type Zn-finger protein